MDERTDALASLLAVIGREVDPSHSQRVARALRRVVVRALDQRVSRALMCADPDMVRMTSPRIARRAGVPARNLVVLAESLAVLRPDGRSLGLAGRARGVAERARTA